MNRKSWVRVLFLSLLFSQVVDSQAQKIVQNVQIVWENNLVYTLDAKTKQEFLYFQGAVTSAKNEALPTYVQRFSVDNFFENYKISIQEEEYLPLTAEEVKLIPSSFNQTSLEVDIQTFAEAHNNFAVLSFVPIIKIGEGRFQKLKSCQLTIEGVKFAVPKMKGRAYSTNSVLRYGNWYKIAVSESGIYKVTYNDLVELGVSVQGLESSRIGVYGNGGGMLAEANSVARPDDLLENAIFIDDGGDGQFDEGDYFLFYALGPHKCELTNNNFSHFYNIYSDYAYYFINVDGLSGTPKRINTQNNSSLTTNKVAETYTHFDFIEKDSKNFGESGKEWFGDAFDIETTRNYSFSLPSQATSSTARVTVAGAGVSTQQSAIEIKSGSRQIGNLFFPAVGDAYAKAAKQNFSFSTVGTETSIPFTLTYQKPTVSSAAYLDYIELQVNCKLQMQSGQFLFCNLETVGAGNSTEFKISNADNRLRIWNVTDPANIVEILGTLNNNVLSIKAATETVQKFVAFNGSTFKTAKLIGKIANQDLHGSSDVDMIIVVYPDFESQAERLAQYRRDNDGLSVKVVTPQQIYNEFSSGAADVTAIRDYMRMIYKTSAQGNPKYLLLFGKASYDYRGRVSGNKLYVPNYQYHASLDKNSYRSNDDFFGLLDDNEGEDCEGLIDVAIGRFPVTTLAQAKIAVDKTIAYSATENLLPPNSLKVSNLADWRNIMTFVADDEDSYHILTTESAADFVEATTNLINFDKIYLDSYQQISSAGEQSYPEVNRAIENRINRGSLIFMYVGHSGVKGWAHERILDLKTINEFSNRYNQSILITMGCEFGWYDRATVSPAEMVFLNPHGGATGQITTSRVAFSLSNKAYSDFFFKNVMKKFNQRYLTLGELNQKAKNDAGGAMNSLNMIFTIGDPAMKLAIPTYTIITDSVNGVSVLNNIDTLKALSKVTISGHIVDENSALLSDFNGNLYPTVFDKKTKVATLQNDPQSPYVEYFIQKSILFKGNVSVKNGKFTFSFIVPQDIDFQYGNGKISYYAASNVSDANGAFDDFIIGGKSSDSLNDKSGPEIELYMNDENFVNGGITDQNPTLLVKLSDELGINTTGNGIGHDLVAILDGKLDKQIVLNDYYITVQDSFNCGTVRYPFKNLSVGAHTLKLRAWDILNNPSEKTLEFVVASDEKLTLEHVLNYPNPFTTRTAFYFEHNLPNSSLDILIQIYTVTGKIVKTIESFQVPTGNRCEPIYWDGKDDYGDKLGKGTYIYRLKVKSGDGKVAEKIEKLVLL